MSLSRGASDSTSATNELAAVSSLSSIVRGPTGTAAGLTPRPLNTRLDEMIAAETKQHVTTSTHRPTSLLSDPVRQSALKRQSYLDKLVSDVDRRCIETDVSATNSDVSPGNDRPRQQQSRDEQFPPPPSDEELYWTWQRPGHQQKAVSVNRRLYKSPFLLLPANCQNTGGQSATVKSFNYREFQRTGSMTSPTSMTRTGTVHRDDVVRPSSTSAGRQREPVGSGQLMVSGAGGQRAPVGSGQLMVSGGPSVSVTTARPYSAVSGVKPASHHEPSRHSYVLSLIDCSRYQQPSLSVGDLTMYKCKKTVVLQQRVRPITDTCKTAKILFGTSRAVDIIHSSYHYTRPLTKFGTMMTHPQAPFRYFR